MPASVEVKRLAVIAATGRLEGCGPQLSLWTTPTPDEAPRSFTSNHLQTRRSMASGVKGEVVVETDRVVVRPWRIADADRIYDMHLPRQLGPRFGD